MDEEKVPSIGIEEFIKLDYKAVTLVDLREPDEVLIKGIPDAICRTGDLDKTIAAFIMANGAAAMGRKATAI